jgi:hypothetical protein
VWPVSSRGCPPAGAGSLAVRNVPRKGGPDPAPDRQERVWPEQNIGITLECTPAQTGRPWIPVWPEDRHPSLTSPGRRAST